MRVFEELLNNLMRKRAQTHQYSSPLVPMRIINMDVYVLSLSQALYAIFAVASGLGDSQPVGAVVND